MEQRWPLPQQSRFWGDRAKTLRANGTEDELMAQTGDIAEALHVLQEWAQVWVLDFNPSSLVALRHTNAAKMDGLDVSDHRTIAERALHHDNLFLVAFRAGWADWFHSHGIAVTYHEVNSPHKE
jgi:hypothetical protein